MEMTKQEQIEIIINKSCNENAIALSEVETAVIALDLLKSGLIAFGNQKIWVRPLICLDNGTLVEVEK